MQHTFHSLNKVDFQGINMKISQKITILLISIAVVFFTALNFISQRNTPKTLGQNAFPFKEE